MPMRTVVRLSVRLRNQNVLIRTAAPDVVDEDDWIMLDSEAGREVFRDLAYSEARNARYCDVVSAGSPWSH